jgi:RNA polymerase sigma-70 factor (ECF subfamily)
LASGLDFGAIADCGHYRADILNSRRIEQGYMSGLAGTCSDLARRKRPAADSRDDAEDAAQDAYLRALQLAKPEEIRDPRRYILRMAANLFIDRRRKEKREARIFERSGDIALSAEDGIDPERILAGKQALDGILGAIQALPPRCREAFVLHRFDGLNYAAIGNRMGISMSMVEKHIAEAMARLSKTLKEEAP